MQAAKHRALAESDAPAGFEGIADGGDAGALGYGEERARDAGEDVGVLVRVDVGEGDALLQDASDLREGFARDVGFGNLVEEDGCKEVGGGRTERLAVGAGQGGDSLGRREGYAVGQDDVAANP